MGRGLFQASAKSAGFKALTRCSRNISGRAMPAGDPVLGESIAFATYETISSAFFRWPLLCRITSLSCRFFCLSLVEVTKCTDESCRLVSI